MNGTLLIVEDEENYVFFLKDALKKAGIITPIQVVEDGRLAIDYLSGVGKFADRKAYPLPSVVFLDLKLPQVNGLAILKWIREQPHLPSMLVVILTASSLDEDIERAYRLGANSYVVKPSSRDKLVEILKDFNNWWFKHNEPPPRRIYLPVGAAA